MSLTAKREELARLLDRSAPAQGAGATAIVALKLVRFTRPAGPIRLHQRVALWFVAQGRTEIVLADETFACGPDGWLVVPLDLPDMTRVAEALEEKAARREAV